MGYSKFYYVLLDLKKVVIFAHLMQWFILSLSFLTISLCILSIRFF
jgi:hypothetical protein